MHGGGTIVSSVRITIKTPTVRSDAFYRDYGICESLMQMKVLSMVPIHGSNCYLNMLNMMHLALTSKISIAS